MISSIPSMAPIRSIPDADIGAESIIGAESSSTFVPTASPLSAALPSTADLALKGTGKNLLWQAEDIGGGRSLIELGDDYALGFNTLQREVVLANRKTQETTRIFGNAEVATDGAEQLKFWGTTTFALANGTKITANAVPDAPDSINYLLDRLTITDDFRAMVISGLSVLPPPIVPTTPAASEPVVAAPEPSAPADAVDVPQSQTTEPAPAAPAPVSEAIPPLPVAPVLKVETLIGEDAAWRIDNNTRDGYVLEENSDGAGWISEWTDKVATQQDLNDTAIGEVFGPNSETMSGGEFGSFLNQMQFASSSFAFSQSMRQQSFEMFYETRTREQENATDRTRIQKRLIEMQDIRRLAEMVNPYEMMLQQAFQQARAA